jgi:REP element-mobilizing transposase RayT
VVHVTIGFREGLVNLRRKKEAQAIWRAFAAFRDDGAVTEDEFRMLKMSIQRDHLHLGVEAESLQKLSSAIQRLKQRMQSALQKLWGISGSLYRGRYHMRVAETATEVRRLFAYVLGNARHHGAWKDASTDPFSTAYWFEEWHRDMQFTPPTETESIVSKARSWLARIGWKHAGRKGPLHYTEVALPSRR